jgi:hypothetical protein
MKINDIGAGKRPSSVKRKKSSGGNGARFAEALKDAAGSGETAKAAAAQPVHAVDAVLAMQESDDATERRARAQARQYGESLLDQLDAIRHDLLIGAVPKARLGELAQRMRAQRAHCQDPRLMSIIDEIELRCEVEIAKLTR